jgi:hypothetical protein
MEGATMKRPRPSPRKRIGRIFERVYKLENRLIAKHHRIPAEERPAFQATGIAKVNAIMKKAVLACTRVMASTKPKARRTRKTR